MGGACFSSNVVVLLATPGHQKAPTTTAFGTPTLAADNLEDAPCQCAEPEPSTATAEDKHRALLHLDVPGWTALLDKLEGVFGRKRCDIAATEHRAITLQHLQSLLKFAQENCHEWWDTRSLAVVSPSTVNLYQLADWCIRPATARDKCSMAELLVETTSPPTWYLSHWWGEPLQDFYACVEAHTKIRQLPPTAAYWVCAHANRQWELNEELTKDPSQSSFYKAMVESEGILLLLDKNGTPFTRIWCAYEAYVGLVQSERDQGQGRLLFDIATSKDSQAFLVTDGPTAAEDSCFMSRMTGLQEAIAANGGDQYRQIPEEVLAGTPKERIGGQLKTLREMAFPDEVMQLGFNVDVEKAAATCEDDRRHILNKINGRAVEDLDEPIVEACPAYKAVGQRIGGLMARTMWVKAAACRKTRSLGLPAALAADQECRELTFDFTSVRGAELCTNLILDLGRGLHKNLKVLQVVLNFCHGSSPWATKADADAACQRRSRALQGFLQQAPNLEVLSLDFYWWMGLVGDRELAALGQALMQLPKLRELSLKLIAKSVTESGLAAFALCLRKVTTLEELNLFFQESRGLGKGVIALGQTIRELRGLRKLGLSFDACAFDHEGVAALTAGVNSASQLQEVHLSFAGCRVHGTPSAYLTASVSVLAGEESIRLKLLELTAQVVREGEASFSRGEAALDALEPTFAQEALQRISSEIKEEEDLGESADRQERPLGFSAYWYCPRGPWLACLSVALSQCPSLSDFTLFCMFRQLDDKGLRLLSQAACGLKELQALNLHFLGQRISEREAGLLILQVAKLQRLSEVRLIFEVSKGLQDLALSRMEELGFRARKFRELVKEELQQMREQELLNDTKAQENLEYLQMVLGGENAIHSGANSEL